MSKKLKLYIELPENILDMEIADNLSFLHVYLKDYIKRAIRELLVEKYLRENKLPELELDSKEIKEAVKQEIISKLAEKALER